MCMVLHDPERIQKCLIAHWDGLCGFLGHALKIVSQVGSRQAGNIARVTVESEKIGAGMNTKGRFPFSANFVEVPNGCDIYKS